MQPFFDGLKNVAAELKGAAGPELRIGGAELVLRDHLPAVVQGVRKRYPQVRISLRTTGFQSQVEEWLREGQIDLAFVPVPARAPAGLGLTRFARLPVVLEVPRASQVKRAEELWARKTIAEPLICLQRDARFVQDFFSVLKKRGVSWPHVIEATSLDLVARYVANGDGIGLSVLVDPKAKPRGVRVLPLEGFTPVTMGALWRGQATGPVQAAIDGVRDYATKRWPEWACAE